MSSPKIKLTGFIVILFLTTLACSLSRSSESNELSEEQLVQTALALTVAAQGNGGEQPQITPVPSNTPTLTPSPTVPPPPTEDIPLISVSQDTNCRIGPGVVYDYQASAISDEEYEVVGLWDGGADYVLIDIGSINCWLWTRYAYQSDFSPYNLPSHPTPPTPTPTVNWSGPWEMYFGNYTVQLSITQQDSSITADWDFIGPSTVTHTGTLSDDLQTVSGTWVSTNGSEGTFFWMISGNGNQFSGNDGFQGVCGAKNGAPMPSPCGGP